MPFKYGYRKKSYRKRPVKKYTAKKTTRYIRQRPRLQMSRYPTEARKLVRFKFVSEPITINAGAGTLGIHIFAANGLFKPDITGVLTTHQPMGFDQWMLFYEHFHVLGSKITATFNSAGTIEATDQLVCGIYTDSNTTSTGVYSDMLEQPGTLYKFLGTGDAQPYQRVTKTFSAKKFFGVKNVIDNHDQEGSDISNPSEMAFFHVFCGASNGTSDASPVVVNVQITYIALLTERRTLTPS